MSYLRALVRDFLRNPLSPVPLTILVGACISSFQGGSTLDVGVFFVAAGVYQIAVEIRAKKPTITVYIEKKDGTDVH